jgi:hypothetical protein
MTVFTKNTYRALIHVEKERQHKQNINSRVKPQNAVNLSTKEIIFPMLKKREMRKSNPKNTVKLEFLK